MHPGLLLGTTIKDQGRTQKKFAILVGKKVSEINELIKGKRNITIQRDYLLHKVLGTPMKYWIHLQLAYDYQTFLDALLSPTDIPSSTNIPSSIIIPEEEPPTEKETRKQEQTDINIITEKEKIFRDF